MREIIGAIMSKRNPIGRPRAIEGEAMVVGTDLLASMVSPTQGGVYFLSPDEIIRRKGWSIYKEMLHDDQVRVALEFKKVLVAGRTYDMVAHDETPAAKLQAKFASEILCRLNMVEVFRNALTAFDYGFSIAEQVFERDTWDEDGNQYVFLKAIKHRDPKDIQLKMDVHGNFIGAQQVNVGVVAGGNVPLDASKLWLFTHDPQFGNLYGTSDLRSAYRSWFAKKFVIQFWNVYLERFGAPMTKMTYPAGASDDLKTKLKAILTNLASKTEILVPEGVQVNLIEATRGGNAGYTDALAFHNNSIARAILVPALLGDDGDASRASNGDSQSFLQLRVMFKLADQISQTLAKTLMEQVIQPLLDINFAVPLYPKFIWQDYGQFEGMAVADEIRQLFAAGLIDPDQTDINYVRSIVGLPIRDEDGKPDEVVRPAAIPPPGNGTPPPAAPQGNKRADKGGSAKTDSTNDST